MELNEKIAARRKELADEAIRNKQAEKAKEIEMQGRARKEAIKRLSDKGVESVPDPAFDRMVEAEMENILNKAASERMKKGEKNVILVIFIFGVWCFWVKWWLGVLIIIFGAVLRNWVIALYKNEILSEGDELHKGKTKHEHSNQNVDEAQINKP